MVLSALVSHRRLLSGEKKNEMFVMTHGLSSFSNHKIKNRLHRKQNENSSSNTEVKTYGKALGQEIQL